MDMKYECVIVGLSMDMKYECDAGYISSIPGKLG